MLTEWKYNGVHVRWPRGADIPVDYLPGRRYGGFVQELLGNIRPWAEGTTPPPVTGYVEEKVFAHVVPIDGRRVHWGIHIGHHARVPQPSPFVDVRDPFKTAVDRITVQVAGTVDQPMVVRVNAGDPFPPLPWQNSVRDWPGGAAASVEFWLHHAFANTRLIKAGTHTTQPPQWYQYCAQ